MNNQQHIANINKKITLFSILDFPAVLALGIGLFSKYGSQGQELHPLLNDSTVANSLIVVGAAVMLFCAVNVIRLHRAKSRLTG